MPNIQSKKKNLRKIKKKTANNRAIKAKIKTLYKKISNLVLTKEKENELLKLLATFYKAADKAVFKGIFKKNTIARKKSNLAKKILNSNLQIKEQK